MVLERPGAVLALLAIWLLIAAGWRPLMLPDEGRYTGVAWEMLNGDGLTPTLRGLPYFHKPPLSYWIQMGAMQVLGPVEIAARTASIVGAWLMGAMLYLDLRRRVGPEPAALGLAVLATTPFFFIGAQYANHDMLVAGMITVAITCALRAVEPGARLRWVVAAWAAAAGALLAKGLIGVVLPGLVLLPWLLWQRRWSGLARLLHPLGPAVFALVAGPWLLVMQARFPGFADYFFLEQHVRRYAAGGFNNVQPAWFFLWVLPLVTLPWSPVILVASRRRRDLGCPAGPTAAAVPVALLAWWVAAVLLFFSLPQSKLVGYVMPALAPWAALIGLALVGGRAWRVLAPVAALACLAIAAGLAWKAPHSHRDVGLVLGAQWQPGDRVALVGEPFFDVPFYARLREPPVVLADWADPQIPLRDDWRKELADAARFAAPARAQRLWPIERAAQLLCTPGRVWFVAGSQWSGLPGLEAVRVGRHATLWRGQGQAGCG